MTRSLPWSIALHLLIVGAIVAASGNTALRGGRFLPGTLIVALERAAPEADHAKPAVKQIAARQENTAMPSSNTRSALRANAHPLPLQKQKKPLSVQTQTRGSAQAKTPPAVRAQSDAAQAQTQAAKQQARAALFQNMRMRQNRWMWRSASMMWRPSMAPNPWLAASKKTTFLNSVQADIKSILAEKIKKAGISPLGGMTAKILLSYGPDGRLAAATVSTDSDELKALLKGINWQAVPLPGTYGLSIEGLALRIKVAKGITIAGQPL